MISLIGQQIDLNLSLIPPKPPSSGLDLSLEPAKEKDYNNSESTFKQSERFYTVNMQSNSRALFGYQNTKLNAWPKENKIPIIEVELGVPDSESCFGLLTLGEASDRKGRMQNHKEAVEYTTNPPLGKSLTIKPIRSDQPLSLKENMVRPNKKMKIPWEKQKDTEASSRPVIGGTTERKETQRVEAWKTKNTGDRKELNRAKAVDQGLSGKEIQANRDSGGCSKVATRNQ